MDLEAKALRFEALPNRRDIHRARWTKQEVTIPGYLCWKPNFWDGSWVGQDLRFCDVGEQIVVPSMIVVIVGVDHNGDRAFGAQVYQGLLEALLCPPEAGVHQQGAVDQVTDRVVVPSAETTQQSGDDIIDPDT